MSRTITEGGIDLDKFPTSRLRQLVKKFESSNATVHYIKQVAGDLQASQISLMWHQGTELQTNRHNKKRRPVNKQRHHKVPENQVTGQVRKHYDNKIVHKNNTDVISMVTQFIHRGFNALLRNTNVKCHKYGHFPSLYYQKKNQAHHNNSQRNCKVLELNAGPAYVQDSSICSHSEESNSNESF